MMSNGVDGGLGLDPTNAHSRQHQMEHHPIGVMRQGLGPLFLQVIKFVSKSCMASVQILKSNIPDMMLPNSNPSRKIPYAVSVFRFLIEVFLFKGVRIQIIKLALIY